MERATASLFLEPLSGKMSEYFKNWDQEVSRLEAEQAALGSSSVITAEFLGITQVIFTLRYV